MDELAAHAQDPAVAVERHLHVPILVALLRRGEEILAPVLDPLDRALEAERRGGDHRLLDEIIGLGAEAAAHVGTDDADLRRIEPEQKLVDAAMAVRRLAGDPERELVGRGIVVAKAGAVLDRVAAAAMLPERDRRAVRRLRERGRDIAVALHEAGADIVLRIAMRQGRARRETRAAIGHDRQQLVLDLDEGRRILGDIAAFGEHDGHALARLRHLVAHERKRHARLADRGVRHTKRDAVLAQTLWQIGVRQNGMDAGERARGRGVDPEDARVRVGAPHERRVQRARQIDVVDEPAHAAQQRLVLEPLHRRAEMSLAWHGLSAAFAFPIP
jgi:hypothetical protein